MNKPTRVFVIIVTVGVAALLITGCGLDQVVGDVVNGKAAERTATNVHDVLDASNSDVIVGNIPAPTGDCTTDRTSLNWLMGKVAHRNLNDEGTRKVNDLVTSVVNTCGTLPDGYSDWATK